MSDRAINVDRVLDLAEAVCDESASENDFVELDAILLADADVPPPLLGLLPDARHAGDGDCGHIVHSRRCIEQINLDSAALTPWESEALMAAMPPTASSAPLPSSPSSPPPSTARSAISPRAGRWRIWWRR